MITEPVTVVITPMRRRHVRSVLRIEEQVYPRPWTSALFLSELALLELAAGRLEREEFVAPRDLAPVYLRESDAVINWERAELRAAP